MHTILKKDCLACGRPVSGRSDKKFCDDYCRNNYHNQRSASAASCVRKVNGILGRNRSILESLCRETPGKRKKVSVSRMQDAGFRFGYFTHTRNGPRGHTYYFCYDHGFRSLEKDRLLLVANQEKRNNDSISP